MNEIILIWILVILGFMVLFVFIFFGLADLENERNLRDACFYDFERKNPDASGTQRAAARNHCYGAPYLNGELR